MLSRVADNLYWFARYVRRAENTARLLSVASHLQLDLPRSVRLDWQPLITTVGADELFEAISPPGGGDGDAVRFLLLEPRNPSSVLAAVTATRETLRGIRDHVPQQVWETINGIHIQLSDDAERTLTRRLRAELLMRVLDACLKVSALLNANVSRDTAYHFITLGTALEQADMTTRILDAGASGLVDAGTEEGRSALRNMQWMAVLRALEAYPMYRRHVRQRVTGEHTLRFLIQDEGFPRSVRFCLVRAQRVLPALPARPRIDRPLQRLIGLVRNADPASLANHNPTRFLDEIQSQIGVFHQALAEGFFDG